MELSCSGIIGQIMVHGMGEVIGREEVESILASPGLSGFGSSEIEDQRRTTFLSIGVLQSLLQQRYGSAGGKGILARAGRSAFREILTRFNDRLGFAEPEFRLQHNRVRLHRGLEKLAEILSELHGHQIAVSEAKDHWLWAQEGCPYCWQQRSDGPACFFSTGLLQEFFFWCVGGKVFVIRETECIAAGDKACVIRIDKEPIE